MIGAIAIASQLALGVGASGDSEGVISGQWTHKSGFTLEAGVVDRNPFGVASWRWQMDERDTRFPPFFQLGLAYMDGGTSVQEKLNILIGFGATWKHVDFRFVHVSPGRHSDNRTAENKDGINFFQVALRVK